MYLILIHDHPEFFHWECYTVFSKPVDSSHDANAGLYADGFTMQSSYQARNIRTQLRVQDESYRVAVMPSIQLRYHLAL
jgi:hypothetical protein